MPVPKGHLYGSETLAISKLAFEEACAALSPEWDSQSTRTFLAERILKAAAAGARDPMRLKYHALEMIQ